MGVVSGGGYHDVGATVTLTAVPAEGFKFVEWRSAARGVLGSETSIEIQLSEGEEIIGSFAKKTDEDLLKGIFD